MDKLSYPDGIYQYIFRTALFVGPTHILTGLYYGMNHCSLIGMALYATSLNYWKYPLMDSYARKIDMVVAKCSVAYHLYLSFFTSNMLITTLPICIGSGLYFLSLYLEKKNWTKTAALCHCGLHVLVSIGASCIYRDLGGGK
jgi:hypothetical protein